MDHHAARGEQRDTDENSDRGALRVSPLGHVIQAGKAGEGGNGVKQPAKQAVAYLVAEN